MGAFNGRRKRQNKDEIANEKELFIIQQFAQLKSVAEVTNLCNEKFTDKVMSMPAVRYYKETRAPIIEELKDKYLSNLTSIPIANEKTRLQRAEDLYKVATTILNKKELVETSLKCLKEAREEIKGEGSSTQNFLQLNQYNELTDEQLLDKKRELENKFLELSKKGAVYVAKR